MNSLQSLFPEVREVLNTTTPGNWPGLKRAVDGLFVESVLSEAALPLASCMAVGGNPRKAIHVTAALITIAAALRIYDDVEDQDRPNGLWGEVGAARAWNYASALQNLSFSLLNNAPLSHDRHRMIAQLFIDGFFNVTAGQDRDLGGATKTVDDYWFTIALKCGCAYATACASGAMVGTDDPRLIEGCQLFGHHLGLSKQILNDMESIWLPDGVTDIQQGKLTLPLIYGISFDHPARQELKSIIKTNELSVRADRVKEILDGIEVKNFLLWAALKEREQALTALSICPNDEGKAILEAYVTGMFGDIDSLVEND